MASCGSEGLKLTAPETLRRMLLLSAVTTIARRAAKQIGHDLDAGIAGMIQARQVETGLDCLEQRVAVVVGGALHSVAARVG